jgi:hypothetical protein
MFHTEEQTIANHNLNKEICQFQWLKNFASRGQAKDVIKSYPVPVSLAANLCHSWFDWLWSACLDVAWIVLICSCFRSTFLRRSSALYEIDNWNQVDTRSEPMLSHQWKIEPMMWQIRYFHCRKIHNYLSIDVNIISCYNNSIFWSKRRCESKDDPACRTEVFQENAVSCLIVRRFCKKVILSLNSKEASSSHKNDFLDKVNEAILLALSDEPCTSVLQIARRISIPKSIIYLWLVDSLYFTVSHIYWVSHKLSDSQKVR